MNQLWKINLKWNQTYIGRQLNRSYGYLTLVSTNKPNYNQINQASSFYTSFLYYIALNKFYLNII